MQFKLLCIIFLLLAIKTSAQDKLLQQYLDSGDYFKLRDELVRKDKSLNHETNLYYSAFKDNAFNRNKEAIRKGNLFLSTASTAWTPRQVLRMEEMLLDAYVKTYRYKDASELSDVILAKYAGRPPLENAKKIWAALSNIPPQTAEFKGISQIPIKRNIINLWEIQIKFGSREEKFIFDTGANISTVSESYAQKLQLKRIDVSIDVNSGQGKTVMSELAVADSLLIGNTLFRNVIFLVMPDEKLNFPQANITLNGIIGFPVISAMKEIHISKAGMLTIPVQSSTRPFQNLMFSGLTPMIQTQSNSDTLIFQFDTGAAFTHLFSNYLEKYKEAIKDNSSKERIKMMSAGGGKNMKVYSLRDLKLQIGNDRLTLKDVKIYTKTVHNAGRGIAMGNMGQDVISNFDEMILNFDNMFIDFQ